MAAAASDPVMAHAGSSAPSDSVDQALRLHLGGQKAKPGWRILNIQPGPNVDYVGDCTDLGRFADQSVDEVYASHVHEHLDYIAGLPRAFREVHRVLKPGGQFYVSVPDLDVLCRLFVHPSLTPEQRFHVMRMMFGGQIDEHDYHRAGLSWEFLIHFLKGAGFRSVQRVQEFGLFEDSSSLRFLGNLVSLNAVASK